MLHRRRFILSGSAAAAFAVGPGSDAQARVMRLPSELANEVLTLPGRVVLGNPRGDATLVEFFDYNCGFCKKSAADIKPFLAGDPNVRYILINYAVLGEASIEASRVALAMTLQKTQGGYLALHEKLFQLRGKVGASRAVDVALSLGANREKLIADADSDKVTDALVRASKLGDSLGLAATPSFVAGREAVVGYLDIPAKRKAMANLRRCEAVTC
ncbi:MAG: DsbA family protein [Beijerinckiaceae bacterium]